MLFSLIPATPTLPRFVSTSHSVEHLRDSRVQAPAFQLQKCRAGVRASVQQSGSVEEHTFLLKLLSQKAGKVSDSNCWVSESPVDVKGRSAPSVRFSVLCASKGHS